MKSIRNYYRFVSRLHLWLLCALFSLTFASRAGQVLIGQAEPAIPLLQTKTGMYTNVTVTKKTKDWVFIMHATGVCNIKTSDLPPESRVALGYSAVEETEQKPAPKTTSVSQALAPLTHLKFSEVQVFAKDWRSNGKQKFAELTAGNPTAVYTLLGILGFVYMFISTCFWLICRKTHNAPGPLVWVPILQLIPLLRAANMNRLWFFAFFIPALNIIAQILWCIKIVKARGKSPFVAFLLVLPATNILAFLYLAFSRSAPVEIRRNDILALETA
jgi:hypothetical protein